MKITKKFTMTKKEKDTIINGLKLLILYDYCYKDVFKYNLNEKYDMTSPDEILEIFEDSLNSSGIDIIKD